jgi:hypothetical protein
MKIIEMLHHGLKLFAFEELVGKNHEHGLCYSCDRFRPVDPENNCRIAQEVFTFNKTFRVISPIYGCAIFRQGAPKTETPVHTHQCPLCFQKRSCFELECAEEDFLDCPEGCHIAEVG